MTLIRKSRVWKTACLRGKLKKRLKPFVDAPFGGFLRWFCVGFTNRGVENFERFVENKGDMPRLQPDINSRSVNKELW